MASVTPPSKRARTSSASPPAAVELVAAVPDGPDGLVKNPQRFSDLLAEATAHVNAHTTPHLTHMLIRAKRAARQLDQITFSHEPEDLLLRFNNRCTELADELEESDADSFHQSAKLIRTLLESMKGSQAMILDGHRKFVESLRKDNLSIANFAQPISEISTLKSLEAQARVLNSFSTAFFHRALALDPTHVLPEGQSIVQFYNSRIREGSPPLPSEAEQIVRAKLAIEAEHREKEAIEAAYPNIESLTRAWANGSSVPDALVDTLMRPSPVSVFSPFPSVALPNSNLLPPIFAVPTPEIHRMQNKVQELVALACIRAIAPRQQPDTDHKDWLSRVAILLRSEVDAGCPTRPSKRADPANTGRFEDLTPLKLQHLSDEVLHTFSKTLRDEAEKQRVRTSLDRVLQYKDPVYKLFKGRLESFLRQALHSPPKRPEVPGMRTGLMFVPPSTSSRAGTPSSFDPWHHDGKLVVRLPKGFEGDVFEELVQELVHDLALTIDWAHNLWGSIVGEDLFAHKPEITV